MKSLPGLSPLTTINGAGRARFLIVVCQITTKLPPALASEGRKEIG